jgi:hypothetical protein
MNITPAAAHLLPELKFPFVYSDLSPYCRGVLAEGRGFDFSIDLIIRKPAYREGEFLGVLLASELQCAARAMLSCARNIEPFNQLIENPREEVSITADDLDHLHAELIAYPTFEKNYTNANTLVCIKAESRRIRSHHPDIRYSLRLSWDPTMFPVTAENLPEMLPPII